MFQIRLVLIEGPPAPWRNYNMTIPADWVREEADREFLEEGGILVRLLGEIRLAPERQGKFFRQKRGEPMNAQTLHNLWNRRSRKEQEREVNLR